MRILLAEQQHACYARLLAEAAPDLDIVGGDDIAELAGQAGQCAIWLGQPDLLAGLLRRCPAPAWMQSTWAGITPLLAEGLPRDYRLTRAVGVFGQVMAEYMLTYLLAHERRLLERLASQGECVWNDRPGGTLQGRTVLIVGVGEIGQRVAEFLAPFGVSLLGIASSARAQPPFAEVATLAQLPNLVERADHVLNLLPDTPATHDLYDAALLGRFKPGALFINAGRGVSVVDVDLVEALQAGRLGGAVLDVCREEPLPAEHPFWTTPGLLLTGHSAAPTSPIGMTRLFLDNLDAYQANAPMQGTVDFQRGY